MTACLQRTVPTQTSNNTGYSLLTSQLPSDDDSLATDYSVGDISLLSEYESADSESADEYNNQEETTELLQMESNDDDVIEEQDRMPVDDEETNKINEAVGSSRTVLSNNTEPRQTTSQEHLNSVASADSFGYVLVMDNIDLNVRRSFQRVDRSTQSYHFCHAYAVWNRINTSVLSDGPPSGVLSYDATLPSENDLKRVTDDFKVIVSRYVLS